MSGRPCEFCGLPRLADHLERICCDEGQGVDVRGEKLEPVSPVGEVTAPPQCITVHVRTDGVIVQSEPNGGFASPFGSFEYVLRGSAGG